MKVNRVKTKNGDYIYYLAHSVRKGKKVTTVNLSSLGKHSELLAKYDDPYTELKRIVKQMTLDKLLEDDQFKIKISKENLEANKKISQSNLLNIGHFYLNSVIDGLDLKSFFTKILENRKIEFDAYTSTKFLIIDRIINATSKLKTYNQLNNYYEKPDLNIVHLYRVLDLIEENLKEFQSHIYEASSKIVKRDTRILYYDCTNLYFEKKFEDDFLRYGFGKDGKKKPLVGLGLFMDANGIPLAFVVYSGNTSEQTTLIPIEKQIIKDFELGNLIMITDAGIAGNDNRMFNAGVGRDFIVTESIKKLDNKTKEIIFKGDHWYILGDKSNTSFTTDEIKEFSQRPDDDPYKIKFKNPTFYKTFNINKPVEIGLISKTVNNRQTKKTDFNQRLIVTYNAEYAKYQQTVRLKKIERAIKMIEEKKYDTKDATSPKRYIKQEYDNLNVDLDLDKIADDINYDGFYALSTSLMEDSVKDILKANSYRWKIEDLIKTLKFYLKTRPVYHRKEPRIKAHIAICFTALLVIRIIENKLENKYTTEELLTQIKNMKVLPLNEIIYKSTYEGSHILSDLDKVFNKELAKTAFTHLELNKNK